MQTYHLKKKNPVSKTPDYTFENPENIVAFARYLKKDDTIDSDEDLNVIHTTFKEKWRLGIYQQHFLYVEVSGRWDVQDVADFKDNLMEMIHLARFHGEHCHIFADATQFPLQSRELWPKLRSMVRSAIDGGVEIPIIVKRLQKQPVRMAVVSLLTRGILKFRYVPGVRGDKANEEVRESAECPTNSDR